GGQAGEEESRCQGLDHGVGHVMLFEVDSEARAPTPPIPIVLRTSSMTSDRVPKNNALALVAPADPDGASLWASYLASWTTWNHVRTVASLIIGLCYLEH